MTGFRHGMPPYIVWYIKPRAAHLIEIKTCILLSFKKTGRGWSLLDGSSFIVLPKTNHIKQPFESISCSFYQDFLLEMPQILETKITFPNCFTKIALGSRVFTFKKPGSLCSKIAGKV